MAILENSEPSKPQISDLEQKGSIDFVYSSFNVEK